MTGSPEHDARAEALLAPIDVTIAQARSAALFLGGYARDAAELRGWLEMLGLVPYEPGPPAKHRAEQEAPIVNYERPGR